MAFNYKRLLSGLFLILILILSFNFKLDYSFLIFMSILIGLELIKNDLTDKKLISINLLLFIFIFFVLMNFVNLKIYISSILLISFLYIFKSKKYNFAITYIFFFFLLSSYFILLDFRNIFYLTLIFCFINDTLAYVFGNLLKGPKIIPKISPNKTWSGTLLSFFTSTYLFFNFLNFNIFISFFISLLIFFGDIFFSFFKRIRNIKDYSNFIPGHGGVLDRFDSLILPIIFIFIFVIK